MIILFRKGYLENIQRHSIKLLKGNLKEISQFFEGNFGQNKEKKRIFLFFKVEALYSIFMADHDDSDNEKNKVCF